MEMEKRGFKTAHLEGWGGNRDWGWGGGGLHPDMRWIERERKKERERELRRGSIAS